MNPADRPRKTSTSILVKLAHASAPFLSTFLLVHLSAPLLANVGGSRLSSNVMVRTHPDWKIRSQQTDIPSVASQVAPGKGVLPNPIRRKISALNTVRHTRRVRYRPETLGTHLQTATQTHEHAEHRRLYSPRLRAYPCLHTSARSDRRFPAHPRCRTGRVGLRVRQDRFESVPMA